MHEYYYSDTMGRWVCLLRSKIESDVWRCVCFLFLVFRFGLLLLGKAKLANRTVQLLLSAIGVCIAVSHWGYFTLMCVCQLYPSIYGSIW